MLLPNNIGLKSQSPLVLRSTHPSPTVFPCSLLLDESMNEDVVITKPFGDDRMTCREIRRNSAGCIRFKDECEKCKAIEHIGKNHRVVHLIVYSTATKGGAILVADANAKSFRRGYGQPKRN